MHIQKLNFHLVFDSKGGKMGDKKVKLEMIRRDVERWADSQGKRVDEGIKETVVILNAIGLPTSGSCEGHTDYGVPVPWVDIEAPNAPEERFIGQNAAFARVARKYNITIDEAKSGRLVKVYEEAMKECCGNGETKEHKKWRRENRKLMRKTKILLAEFYQDREVEQSLKLQIAENAEGGFRIHNGGDDYKPISKAVSGQEKIALSEKLARYQKEMRDFTDFLKGKYRESSF